MPVQPANRTSHVLITGASGFIGRHITHALRQAGFEVTTSATHLGDRVHLEHDLRCQKWDLVLHLAGLSLPKDCQNNPSLAYQTNFVGTLNLAELCLKTNFEGLFVFFSTAYVYDSTIEGLISESSPIDPQSVYGRTKSFAERTLEDIARSGRFSVLTLRLFNHSHKSQRPDFFLPSIYQEIIKARTQGATSVNIPMGNPNLQRDFSSIQDLCVVVTQIGKQAGTIREIIRRESHGYLACNQCSGTARRLGDLAIELARQLGIAGTPDPQSDRMRQGESAVVYGSPSRLRTLLKSEKPNLTNEEFIRQFTEDLVLP